MRNLMAISVKYCQGEVKIADQPYSIPFSCYSNYIIYIGTSSYIPYSIHYYTAISYTLVWFTSDPASEIQTGNSSSVFVYVYLRSHI